MKNINTINVLKELVSIPSWVNGKTNEKEIGEWICEFLKKNSPLKISKQFVGKGRFNVIAKNSNKINILVTGHIDTVQPNTGWTRCKSRFRNKCYNSIFSCYR